MSEKLTLTLERLKTLEPISSLSEERLTELLSLAYTERLPVGVTLFREGDVDNQTVYVIKGDVQLSSSDGRQEKIITSRMDEAHYPLDDSQPRQVTAVTMSMVEIARIDNSVLEYMMMWDQLAVSEEEETQAPAVATSVSEVGKPDPKVPASESSSDDEDRSWIRRVRHIMAFKALPPANIRSLLEKMEMLKVGQGDKIVRQGEAGDYYYVLTEGEARVTRTVELARITAGASFGEEALVSDSQRNATVTMLSDGVVMRLAKQDFDALMKEPMLHRLSPDEARVAVAKGARWLDVRHAKEYQRSRLPKASNIPLHEIRMRLQELDPKLHYICYCSTGRRSAAAAFLLKQNGLQASVLNGGLQVMAKDMEK